MNRADRYREISKNCQLAGQGVTDVDLARQCSGYAKYWAEKAVIWEKQQQALWDLREKAKAPKWKK